jgi:hypothetical protein
VKEVAEHPRYRVQARLDKELPPVQQLVVGDGPAADLDAKRLGDEVVGWIGAPLLDLLGEVGRRSRARRGS